jgi:hypothetical protein
MLQALQSQVLSPHFSSSSSGGSCGALEVEAAGLVAAVDESRCLLAMPDAFW